MRQTSIYSALLTTLLVAGVASAQVVPGAGVPGAVAPGTATPAGAGGVRIVFPQEGQDVRGEITIQYEGIPEGGYAIVKLDGLFKQATADPTFVLNTFPPTFPGDGPHRIAVTAINAAGKRVGDAQVTFNVANNTVATNQPSVHLVHWIPQDRLGMPVQRYRIFAESNAIIEESSGGAGGGQGGGASGGASSGGGAGGGGDFLPAPLDWQISALVRRVVRDVGMVDGSANIRTVVQEALQRQRYGATSAAGGEGGASGGASSSGGSGGSGGGRGSGGSGGSGGRGASGGESTAPAQTRPGCVAVTLPPNPLAKGPWNLDSCGPWWDPGTELGQYFVKMIMPSGEEINATRKASNVGLADLFPIFPPGDVKPGSSWTTTMTFISELSTRAPINLRDVPIVFTTFENFTTPAGEQRRAAKLESQRFRLPPSEAMKIAQRLDENSGSGGGGGEGGASGGSGGSGGSGRGGSGASGGRASGGSGSGGGAGAGAEIQNARTVMTRVLWFDVEGHRVLRSEDTVDTYYESLSSSGAEGGGGSGGSSSSGGTRGAAAFGPQGGAEGGTAPAEPKKVFYNMRISTWLDDRIPNPTDVWTGGRGTVHDPTPIGRRDTTPVRDPVLASTLQPGAPTSISDRAAAGLH